MVKRIVRKHMYVSVHRDFQILQSYDEEVGIYLEKQNAIILTSRKFSATTSRHKNIFKRMFPENTIVEVVPPSFLKSIIAKERQKDKEWV